MRLPSDATLIVVDDRRDAGEALEPDDANETRRLAGASVGALLDVWRAVSLPVVSTYPADGAAPFGAPASPLFQWCRREGVSVFSAPGVLASLDARGCTTLIVCGFDTDGGVEASVRHAADLGFRLFVVADACAASSMMDDLGAHWSARDVHAMALARMASHDVRIVDTRSAWIAAKSAGWGKR